MPLRIHLHTTSGRLNTTYGYIPGPHKEIAKEPELIRIVCNTTVEERVNLVGSQVVVRSGSDLILLDKSLASGEAT